MNAIAVSEQLYCAGCSDPVDVVDEHNFGRCCRDLPNPWHRGSDGLYNLPSESEDAEDEDDDQRPTCRHCGSMQFEIHAREWRLTDLTATASSRDNDDHNDSQLWFGYDDLVAGETSEADDFEILRIVCVGCRQDVTEYVEAEQL